jgi:ribokinase
MLHIVVVGSLNMDLVVRTPRLPLPGETILGQDFRTIPGGKGANQAVVAARLGARVSMVGRVGDDSFGRTLLNHMRREGIDITHVERDEAEPTGIAMITVDAGGQNSIVVASGANFRLTSEQVAMALSNLPPYDALILQLESPLDAVLVAARRAQEAGARVILNPAPARPLPETLLDCVDVLIPNESEASLLASMPIQSRKEAEEAARRLLDRGLQAVILTRGGEGALVVTAEGRAVHLPPHQVEVVDATAAGDAFVAGVTVGLGEGLSLIEAARLGNATGAMTVTRMGAQSSFPTREEVEELLRQY